MQTAAAYAWLSDFAAEIHEHAGLLTELDSAIGDADHGANMDRGMKAVVALDPAGFATAADLCKKAGMTLVSTVGGASGPLYGTFLLRFAAALGGPDAAAELGAALRAGVEGILARGKAELGDKTMVDAFEPAVLAFRAEADRGSSVADAFARAAEAAEVGMKATTDMIGVKGRGFHAGERGMGHQDPGATSCRLLLQSIAETLRSKT